MDGALVNGNKLHVELTNDTKLIKTQGNVPVCDCISILIGIICMVVRINRSGLENPCI